MSATIDALQAATADVTSFAGGVDLSEFVRVLADDRLLSGLGEVAEARKALDLIGAAFASEIDRRSVRDLGYGGLAQRTGFRTATSLIQNVTGQSAGDVRRATAVGNDLAETAATPAEDDGSPKPDQGHTSAPAPVPWFASLTDALRARRISREQYDAIRRSLGEPPVERYPGEADQVTEAWRQAACILIEEAADQTVEDLRASARLARDTLDPIGTQLRFDERYEKRSFTMWVDENGQRCARIRFDDDAGAWVRTILNAALRPRRGPRFVDPERPENDPDAADAPPVEDRRSNEQLQYDTILAVLKTGSLADPTQAFGDRQPGVRIVVTREDIASAGAGTGARGAGAGVEDAGAGAGAGAADAGATAVYEETGQSLPGGVLQTYLCNAATLEITVDGSGNPLDVGRERRLFTPKQRIALALRDGGCLWCGAEPSRCEAHHLKTWSREHGRTDLADGVLLCRNCHMRLHNQGWRIVRNDDEYWLHPPPSERARGLEPRRLRPRRSTRFMALRA